MSCVVERHLLQTVPALHNLTTAEQMPAVCPLLSVLLYCSPCALPWCNIPQESQLISHQGTHQKKVYALAGMVRQSLTGMWRARTGQSGAEQSRRLLVQLAEIRLAAQDGSDAVKLALVLFGKGTARVPGCDIPLAAVCPGVCGGSRPAFFQYGPTRGLGEWAAVPCSCSSISSLFSVLGWHSPGIALGWYTLALSTFLSACTLNIAAGRI